MLLHETYTYPSHPHPHKDYLPEDVKYQLVNVFLNGISQYDVNDIIDQEITAVEYMRNRKNKLKELGVSQDHLVLLDCIFTEMNQCVTRFLKHGVTLVDLTDEKNRECYADAKKAALEHYFFEPFMPENVLEGMRKDGVTTHPKRRVIDQAKLDEFIEKQPMTWDVIG